MFRYAALMSARVHSLNTGAHELIDYLMVIALALLLVVLSLPTILQLAGFLRADREARHSAVPANNRERQEIADVPSSSRFSPVRSQSGPADRAAVETQLAH
jgi:hypothetical protein